MDFFTVEVWTAKTLTHFHVLIVIDLSKRRVEIARISDRPQGAWVQHVLRRQFDEFDGLLRNHKYLIHDRDPLFTKSMIEMLAWAGGKSVKLPPESPKLNAKIERFFRTLKRWLRLSCLIPTEARNQERLNEFQIWYNQYREHGEHPAHTPNEQLAGIERNPDPFTQ